MLSGILGKRNRRNTPKVGDAWPGLPSEYPDGPRELKYTSRAIGPTRPEWYV